MQCKLLVSMILVAVIITLGLAQEPADPKPQDDKEKAAGKADEKKPDGAPPREEHVIYVPYTKLPEVFEKEGASVLLPYAQFLQMWSGAQGPVIPLPIKPPIAGLISRADYVGKVEGDLVRLEATLTVEVLGDEWARLPVQFGDAAVGEATSDDEDMLLHGVGDGKYELLVHGRGKHKISFELVARVQSSADGKSFAINCPLVGVSNLELEIPEPDQTVQVNPRRTSQVQATDKKVTKVQAAIGSTDKFTVSWQPKSGAAAEMAGLASVTDTIEIDVGDGVVHTHAIFDFQVLRGLLDVLAVTMPADQRLLDVQAPGLRDWQTEGADEGRQRLTVRLHATARDKVRLEVRTESPIPEQSFPIAQFQAVGVARENGVIAVRSAEDVGLEFVTHSGVSRIDAAEVPELLRKPRSTFYKFFSPNFQLAIAASGLEPRVAVESFLTVAIEKARLGIRGDFKFDVTRAGIFTVPLRVPAGFNVDEVVCDVMDRHESSTPDDDGQVLTVFLTKKVLGPLKLAVAISQSRTVQSGELELPLIEPIGVPREQGLVAVIAPDAIEVNSDPTKLESARVATPAELAARGFNLQPPPGSTVAASFAFTRRPVKIGLATRERARRVLASVSTVASVKEDIVSVTTKIHYDIQYAGSDTFRFAAPAAAKLEITGDGIKEKRKADEPDDDGSVIWTVVLHSESLGNRDFTVTYDEKISMTEIGVSQNIQPIRLLDVDRETGEIAILKDRSLAIAATHEGLEEIDARELTQPVGKEQPYLSYRYFRHPAKLTLDVTKHEIEGVVKTVVSRAYVEMVVSSEGPISVRARYLIKSSERQRLALALPAARVLGVTVDGRNVLPEKAPAIPGAAADDKSYFINIDRKKGPDEPFSIAIVYEAHAPPGDKLAITDSLRTRLPQFEDGVKFQQLYVRLWLPEQYRAVGEPAGFTSETRSVFDALEYQQINYAREDPDSWFPGDTTTFDFRTAGHAYLYSSLSAPPELTVRYWKIAPMTLAGSLVVLAIGGGLVVLRFEAKILAILAAALAALLAGLFWREAVLGWLAAARIGLASVLALWLVVFLLRVRRAIPLRMAAAGAGTVLLSTVGSSAASAAPAPTPSPDSAASAAPAPTPSLDSAASQPDSSAQQPLGDEPSPPTNEGGSHESK